MTLVDSLAYRSALDHIYHTVLPVRSTIQAGGRPGNIECGTLGTPIVGAPSLRYVYHTVYLDLEVLPVLVSEAHVVVNRNELRKWVGAFYDRCGWLYDRKLSANACTKK